MRMHDNPESFLFVCLFVFFGVWASKSKATLTVDSWHTLDSTNHKMRQMQRHWSESQPKKLGHEQICKPFPASWKLRLHSAGCGLFTSFALRRLLTKEFGSFDNHCIRTVALTCFTARLQVRFEKCSGFEALRWPPGLAKNIQILNKLSGSCRRSHAFRNSSWAQVWKVWKVWKVCG